MRTRARRLDLGDATYDHFVLALLDSHAIGARIERAMPAAASR
jgi:hypothetical protein